MRTIVFASQKGGVGKTTLSGHLAVAAEADGAGPVVLLDTDPQGSLSAWWNERQAESPAFAAADLSRLAEQLIQLKAQGFNLAIIDTPPAITETIANVLKVADLVVIPTRPSPHDLRAVADTVALCAKVNKRPIFIINGAAQRARITAEAAITLSEYGTVAPTVTHQRTDFASSMIDGRTAQELDQKSRSADEISKLWIFLENQLKKSEK